MHTEFTSNILASIKFRLTYSLLVIIPLLYTSCSIINLNKDIDQFIASEIKKSNIPALSYCIIKKDRMVLTNHFGLQKYKKGDMVDQNAIYLLASISKTIVAVAIMQLHERGMINLNDDINNYLPIDIRNPNYPSIPITVNMLLTHTSSLSWPNEIEDSTFNHPLKEGSELPLHIWVKDYLLPKGKSYRNSSWKNYPPGEYYQYSNIGVALLGLIVQNVSKVDFSEYCKKYIFLPLEMNNTGFRLTEVDPKYLVTPVHEGREILQYSVAHYPSSMLKSSIKELSNFLIAIINKGRFKNNKILNPETINLMLTPKITSNGQALIWKNQSKGWIGHIGGYWGTSCLMDLNIEKGVGIIILTNTYGITSIYPEGKIYKRLHKEAQNYYY